MNIRILLFSLLTFLSVFFKAQDLSALKPLDAELSTVTYPFPVQFKELKNQGQNLNMDYMHDKPERANGKTVVLLHGKNFNGYYSEETARSLQKERYRVVMPDQIRFGKSSKPKQYQFSFQQLAENTK